MKEVTAAIIFKDDTVLITRRKKGETLEGLWEFPGGKIEAGETPQLCLERELLEELELNVKAHNILAESKYHYENGAIKLIALRTEVLSGRITLHVHDKAIWVPFSELLNYELAPADIPIAKKLMEMNDGI